MLFTVCCIQLKCLWQMKDKSTVNYGPLSVFLKTRNVKPEEIHRQISEFPGEHGFDSLTKGEKCA